MRHLAHWPRSGRPWTLASGWGLWWEISSRAIFYNCRCHNFTYFTYRRKAFISVDMYFIVILSLKCTTHLVYPPQKSQYAHGILRSWFCDPRSWGPGGKILISNPPLPMAKPRAFGFCLYFCLYCISILVRTSNSSSLWLRNLCK